MEKKAMVKKRRKQGEPSISSTTLRIQSIYDDLGEAEKRIGNLLLENPEEIIH
jgi:hypothetical protein